MLSLHGGKSCRDHFIGAAAEFVQESKVPTAVLMVQMCPGRGLNRQRSLQDKLVVSARGDSCKRDH